MLFLLPPPDDDAPPAGAKAELDQGEASRAAQKVDLDLDDAPFLEDEEEEEAAPAAAAPALDVSAAKEKKALPAWLKSKLVIIGAPVLLLLLIGAVWFFTRPKAEAPPSEAAKAETPKSDEHKAEPAKTKAEAAPPPPPPPTDTLIRMDPFLVEQTTANGTIRFLTARFSLLTKDDKTPIEFQRKIYILRDAIYYYLKNKNLEYLTGRNNTDRLKKDVLGVINQYMGATQFDNLLIEEYLVK